MTNVSTNEWVMGRPGPRVRHIVKGYVGYRMAGFAPATHRGLPSGHLTFIVSIDQPVDVVQQTSGSQAPRTYRTVLGGLHASPALIAHDGNQHGVAITLSPLGARALFGLPAGALWDLTLEFGEVVGARGDELWERVQYADGWRQRFAACDTVLASMATTAGPPPAMTACWTALAASQGRLAIAALARETGYSRQHLARRFRTEFGLTPKLAARIFRFQRASQTLRTAPDSTTLTEIAAACGYADHSHLDRDFADLAGCPPTRWLRDERLPIIQDGPAADMRA